MYQRTQKGGNLEYESQCTDQCAEPFAPGASADQQGRHQPRAPFPSKVSPLPLKPAPSRSVPSPRSTRKVLDAQPLSSGQALPKDLSCTFQTHLSRPSPHAESCQPPTRPARSNAQNPSSADAVRVHSSQTSPIRQRDGASTVRKCPPDGGQDGQLESSQAGTKNDIRCIGSSQG